MSGGEAVLVLGLISSIITIIDTTKNVYDAATSKTGLPKAFGECAKKLPLVKNILESIEKGNVYEKECKEVKGVVEGCKRKASTLEELFQKVIPADGASHLQRYYKAVKTLGKGNEVESLMRGILEDLALLNSERIMKTPIKTHEEQIAKAISEIRDVPKSVPDDLFQETGATVNHSGSGTQYNAWGEYIAQGDARQYNAPGGTMHFGKD